MRPGTVVALAAALMFLGTVFTPALSRADVCVDVDTGATLALDSGPCADVLALEARWLKAIPDGDVATIESILHPNYRHIDSSGRQFDRAAEMADTRPLFLEMTPSEQIVDVAGDIAVVHGVNTINYGSRGSEQVRFTDVFILENGTWMALSAQETAV